MIRLWKKGARSFLKFTKEYLLKSIAEIAQTAEKKSSLFLIRKMSKNAAKASGLSWRTVQFARLSLTSMSNSKTNSGIPAIVGLQMARKIFVIDI
jgi:hypothetical protein